MSTLDIVEFTGKDVHLKIRGRTGPMVFGRIQSVENGAVRFWNLEAEMEYSVTDTYLSQDIEAIKP